MRRKTLEKTQLTNVVISFFADFESAICSLPLKLVTIYLLPFCRLLQGCCTAKALLSKVKSHPACLSLVTLETQMESMNKLSSANNVNVEISVETSTQASMLRLF